jgi:hypothetical protein
MVSGEEGPADRIDQVCARMVPIGLGLLMTAMVL